MLALITRGRQKGSFDDRTLTSLVCGKLQMPDVDFKPVDNISQVFYLKTLNSRILPSRVPIRGPTSKPPRLHSPQI